MSTDIQIQVTATAVTCGSGYLCSSCCKARVDRATEFVASVADPLEPSCCPWCFNILSYDIRYHSYLVTAIQRRAPEFFARCMKLVLLYADADLVHLRARLATNQRACPARSTVHRVKLECNSTDALDIFLWALFIVVQSALGLGKRPIHNPMFWGKAPFYRRKGHWPTALDELFPLGVEAGVKALVSWCCAPPCPHVFGVVAILLHVARPVFLPYLLKPPTRERIIWAVLHATTSGIVPWPGAAPFTMPPGRCMPRAIRGAGGTVDQVLELLSSIVSGYDSQTHDVVEFTAGYEMLLLDTLESHLPAYKLADPNCTLLGHRVIIEEYINILRVILELPDSPLTIPRALPSRPQVIRDCTFNWFCGRFCANARCRAHELTEAGIVRFKVCEFCRVMRYCSRECQRVDWKEGVADITHKMICPMLCKLVSQTNWQGGKGDFDAAYDACDFDAQDVALLYRWSMASGILTASKNSLSFSRPLCLK